MISYVEKGVGLHEEVEASGHRLYQEKVAGEYVWRSSDDVAVQAIIDSFDPLVFERAAAKSRIVSQINDLMRTIEDSYPESEKKTWNIQREEVLAYTADDTAATPSIDAIASRRGIARTVQIATIAAKMAGYQHLANEYAGERQRLFDLLDAETDYTIIQATNFTPPVT